MEYNIINETQPREEAVWTEGENDATYHVVLNITRMTPGTEWPTKSGSDQAEARLQWTNPAGGAEHFTVHTTAFGDQPGNQQQQTEGNIEVKALSTVTLTVEWEAGTYSVYLTRTP